MLKKIVIAIFVLLLVAFVGIQFVRPDFTNPPVVQSEAISGLPDEVSKILKNSCNDCHSHETEYPWYSKIQPSAWFLSDHITQGRKEMNFSVWNTYETRRKRKKLDEICETVTSRAMPLESYTWVHRDAILTEDQIKTVCDWATAESNRLAEGK